jgi:hypothetical protein
MCTFVRLGFFGLLVLAITRRSGAPRRVLVARRAADVDPA